MAAQWMAQQGVWRSSYPSQPCFSCRMASPARVARISRRVQLVRAHASVESMPRKARPGEKKGVRLVSGIGSEPARCPCRRQTLRSS